MRELKIGNKTIRVRATPLALLYYRQEANSDLAADLMKLEALATNTAEFDSIMLLRCLWAMAKADNYGKQFPSFENWLSELEEFSVADEYLISGIIGEAVEGFFRRRKPAEPGQEPDQA